MVKKPPVTQETRGLPLGREDPWKRAWLPTPVFLPRESHGQRSLVGYSPWGHKESDMDERLTLSHRFKTELSDTRPRFLQNDLRIMGLLSYRNIVTFDDLSSLLQKANTSFKRGCQPLRMKAKMLPERQSPK